MNCGSTRAPHTASECTDDPKHYAGNPQLQAQPDGGGQRAVGNRHRAWRAAHENWLGQRAMQRHLKARKIAGRAHTTAPPEKLKNDRKNEDAAKAMDRPNTIWMSLRKPPLVSPKPGPSP